MKTAIADAICRVLRWVSWKADALHIRVDGWAYPPPKASTIGGIAGGVIGHFFSDPKVGFMVDGCIGGYVDPEVLKVEGPTLDLTIDNIPRADDWK